MFTLTLFRIRLRIRWFFCGRPRYVHTIHDVYHDGDKKFYPAEFKRQGVLHSVFPMNRLFALERFMPRRIFRYLEINLGYLY